MIRPGERDLLASYGPSWLDGLDRVLFGSPRPSMNPTTIPDITRARNDEERDAILERALADNGVAPHLFEWVPVQLAHGALRATVYVSPDWIGFGGPRALFRIPLKARAAWRVAKRYGCVLPTKRIVDAIHAQGTVRIPFRGERTWARSEGLDMDDVRVWQRFNDRIEELRDGRGGLVTDCAKDNVAGAMQRRSWPAKVCIYGGWDESDPAAALHADPVQDLSTIHSVAYGDYSQLDRMVRAVMTVEGVGNIPLTQVAASPTMYPLLLDTDGNENADGPLAHYGYE